MGGNNEAIFLYGWSFQTTEFRELIIPLLIKFGFKVKTTTDYYDDKWLFLENCDTFEDLVKQEYPFLTTGRVLPYSRCEPEDCIFYIGLDNNQHDLVEIIRIPENQEGNQIIDCLLKLKQDLNLGNPTLRALNNIH